MGGDRALLVILPLSHGPVEASDKSESPCKFGPEFLGADLMGRPVRPDVLVVGCVDIS